MNSHEFRVVIKNMDASTIKAANINPAHFKAVAFALSMYGDYETGTKVKPSWLTVAKNACVDRKTAMKVRDYLILSGLLIQLSKTEANISVYKYGELSIQDEQLSKTEDQLSIKDNQLSINKDQLSITHSQLSNIDGHNTTIDTTFNTTLNTTVTKVTKFNKPGKKGLEWKTLNLTSPLA